MGAPRDTFKYHCKRGNKTLHTGTCNDHDRRQHVHQREIEPAGCVPQLGRHTTRDGTEAREDEQQQEGKAAWPVSRSPVLSRPRDPEKSSSMARCRYG